MPISIRTMVDEFSQDIQRLFKQDLERIIVYGSYARGDYRDSSDVDIMILVRIPEESVHLYTDQVADCAFEYLFKYGIDISPVIKNEAHFNYWADSLPYYRNVRDEGWIVYAG